MNPIILFRDELGEKGEREIASFYLPTTLFRSNVLPDSLVIGRYSVLPFYEEVEEELAENGSRLINSWIEHLYVADMLWARGEGPKFGCNALQGLTPRTRDTWGDLPENMNFVVKGRTNSRKHQWNTHMFAPTREDVPRIAARLLDDSLINEQGLVVREYIPLKKLGEGVNGLPITNEWRTFWLYGPEKPVLLSHGFYWASHPELKDQAEWTDEAFELAYKAALLVSHYVSFFVLDVAQTEKGDWIVVEVNDGQMSGLSMCDPHELYGNLAKGLEKGRRIEYSGTSFTENQATRRS